MLKRLKIYKFFKCGFFLAEMFRCSKLLLVIIIPWNLPNKMNWLVISCSFRCECVSVILTSLQWATDLGDYVKCCVSYSKALLQRMSWHRDKESLSICSGCLCPVAAQTMAIYKVRNFCISLRGIFQQSAECSRHLIPSLQEGAQWPWVPTRKCR